jgi:hypothetical protein
MYHSFHRGERKIRKSQKYHSVDEVLDEDDLLFDQLLYGEGNDDLLYAPGANLDWLQNEGVAEEFLLRNVLGLKGDSQDSEEEHRLERAGQEDANNTTVFASHQSGQATGAEAPGWGWEDSGKKGAAKKNSNEPSSSLLEEDLERIAAELEKDDSGIAVIQNEFMI